MANGVPRQSRRAVMKHALRAGVYSAPAVLAVSRAAQVAAITPPPPSSTGGIMSTVRFTHLSTENGGSQIYLVQGTGFAPGTPYFFIVSPFNTSNGSSFTGLFRSVLTDPNGNFSYQDRLTDELSSQPVNVRVNGGNIFLENLPTLNVSSTATVAPTVNVTGTAGAATFGAGSTAISQTNTAISQTNTAINQTATAIAVTPTASLPGTATAAARTATANASAGTIAPKPVPHP